MDSSPLRDLESAVRAQHTVILGGVATRASHFDGHCQVAAELAAISEDGSVLGAVHNGTLAIVERRTCSARVDGHVLTPPVIHVGFRGDSHDVVVVHGESLSVIGARTTQTIALDGRARAAAVRPDGRSVAVVTDARPTTISILDLSSATEATSFELAVVRRGIDALAYAPNGKTLTATMMTSGRREPLSFVVEPRSDARWRMLAKSFAEPDRPIATSAAGSVIAATVGQGYFTWPSNRALPLALAGVTPERDFRDRAIWHVRGVAASRTMVFCDGTRCVALAGP